eukprot:TRINITY_DN19205_c0_g1_i1.p2 TRINITY_DN19205_c0_g1~~TRINITY_DN19205_c0_g1_i1.p2  ORF type:complete len:112 (-),score=26.52 TRINITY_DN19205_c0_g1_i1:11-313(-)
MEGNNVEVRSASDVPSAGEPPPDSDDDGGALLEAPGRMPANIYDNGPWANLLEVLLPRCYRRQGRKRMVPARDPFEFSAASYWEEAEEDDAPQEPQQQLS